MNILKSFFQVGLGTAINILLSLFTTPIITRIVDPVDYGKFQMFTTYTGIIAAFLYFGLNESLYRFFYEYNNDKEKSGLLKLCFCIPIVTAILTSIVAIILFKCELINIDYSTMLFVLLCINSIITVWNTISMEMLQNTKQSGIYSLAIVIQKLIYCVIGICLIKTINNNSLLILVIVTILSYFISTLMGTIATKKYWNFLKVSFPKNTKEIINYSLPIYVYFIIYSIYDVVDKIIIENNFSEYDVGIYTSAFSIVGLFAVIQTTFNVIWKPIQTESYSSSSEDKTLIQNGNRYMTIIMFFVGINVIMFRNIFVLFLGQEYRTCVNLIPFLVFNPIFNTLIVSAISGIEYAKKSYLRTIIITISLILELLISKLLIPVLGTYGVAISMALSLIIQYLLTVYFSNKYYYIDYGIKNMSVVLLLTFVFASASVYFSSLVIDILLYVVCTVVLYFLYKDEIQSIYKQLIALIENKRKEEH